MNKQWNRQESLFNTTNILGGSRARMTSTIAKLSVAGLVAMTGVVLSGTSANAWGPTRSTFTMEKPASYVTFNSITNNPDWSDERAFTLIKDITASNQQNNGETAAGGGFTNTATAVDGHTYMVKMFIHNNAAANLNLVAKDAHLMAYVPTASGNSAMIQGMIAANNIGANNNGATGKPTIFWDEAHLKSTDDNQYFKVAVVDGSARYYNNVNDFTTQGFTLNTRELLTENGAKIGYEQMDGNLQGCFQYSGYATFLVKVTADKPSFTLTKQLKVNDNEWSYTGTAKPGDTIKYRVDFRNVGNVELKDVIIRDTLAKNITVINDNKDSQVSDEADGVGLNYVTNSAKFYNSNTGQDGQSVNNDKWTTQGLNIGSYAAATTSVKPNGILTYEATVPQEDELQCGENVFENTVIALTGDQAGSKLATTQVVVNKECKPTPTPTPDPEVPGVPNAGITVKSAVISLALFLVSAVVLVKLVLRKDVKRK